MSTATLNNLLEYLYGTLTPDNMRWVGKHLIEHADKEETLKPYTIEELHERLAVAEANYAAGLGIPDEEAWEELDDELAREKELEMAEAV